MNHDGAMHRVIRGDGLAPPAARYAHAVVSTGPGRLVHTSGIVPITPDGTVPSDLTDQADVVWSSILALLAEADMAPPDIVAVTTYLRVDHLHRLGDVMAARDRYLDGHLAASTLVTVPSLARPEWLIEIAVVAATAT